MIAKLNADTADILAAVEAARRRWVDAGWSTDQAPAVAEPQRDIPGVPATYGWARRGADLEPLLGAESVARLRAAIQARPRMLTVYGTRSGVGKTASAIAAARALSPDGRGSFVRAATLVESMREAGYGHTSDAMHRARSTWLLVLDDLGIEAASEQSREWLCELVWSRADSDKPGRVTIVTTSLTPDQVSTRYGDGMSRRLFQVAALHLSGVAK